MTYYALRFTMLTDLTWDKTVNKYAPGRPPWTSSHSADTFSVGLVLSSILRRWEALVPSASSLPCCCVSTGSPGDVGWQASLLSDQVAPAHHNHSQSYHPSYSDTTGLLRLIERVRGPRTAPKVGSGLRLCWRQRRFRGSRFAAVAAM